MANNRIQIKRSTSNSTVTGLATGELAFTQASNTLHIGLPDGSGVLRIGGAQYPGVLTNSHALVANSTGGIDKIITGNAVITTITANGSIGSAGQVLHSNGSAIYWSTDDEGVTSVATGNGLTGGTITSAGTISALANNGIVANSTGLFAAAANGIVVTAAGINVLGNTGVTVNSTGVHIGQAVSNTSNVTFANVVTGDLTVNGNTKLGDATSDVVQFVARVNTSIVPSTDNTYDIGENLLRWGNVYVNHIETTDGASFGSNVSIDGTLTITGNLVTQNVQSVIVSDPMIYLAGNNYTSDLLDIGFAANYNDGITNRHTGLFRDHTDGIYKLFFNLTQELSGNNDVDTSDASYRVATLQAYLSSGALTTNSTSANLTANSSVTVNIAANTLSLSGRSNYDLLYTNSTGHIVGLSLNTTGGYVLQTNGTAIVYDYLDGGTF